MSCVRLPSANPCRTPLHNPFKNARPIRESTFKRPITNDVRVRCVHVFLNACARLSRVWCALSLSLHTKVWRTRAEKGWGVYSAYAAGGYRTKVRKTLGRLRNAHQSESRAEASVNIIKRLNWVGAKVKEYSALGRLIRLKPYNGHFFYLMLRYSNVCFIYLHSNIKSVVLKI